MYSLSACLIAKNEQKLLGYCLESLVGLAHEIILVDTGSTDQTVAIAKSYGAKVIHTTWENDFSKARNLSLEHATMDWILVIDCDEMLAPSEATKIKILLEENPPYEAFYFHADNWIQNQIVSSAIILRLFRNKPTFRFEGKMHEQISPCITALYGSSSLTCVDISLNHYGYDNDISPQGIKSDRNLKLLLAYQEDAKDDYYYYALGSEYVRLEAFANAIDCYRTSISLCKSLYPKPVCFAYSIMYLSNVYYHLGYYDKVIKNCELGELYLDDFKDLYLIKCLAYKEMGKYSLALDVLHKYQSCIQTNFTYPSKQLPFLNTEELEHSLNEFSLPLCTYTAFLLHENTPSLIESIKNLASSSYKIFAFVHASDLPHLDQLVKTLTALGVHILSVDSFTDENLLTSLYQEVKGNWLLILNGNELMPHATVKQLPDFFASADHTHYAFTLYNWATQVTTSGLRLIHVLDEMSLISIPQALGTSDITLYQNYTL